MVSRMKDVTENENEISPTSPFHPQCLGRDVPSTHGEPDYATRERQAVSLLAIFTPHETLYES